MNIISPPRALTRASSLWAHKVRLRGPGPSSLEKQETLAGSSLWAGVLGAKYAEARAPWDPKRGYQLRQDSLLSPPQPDLLISCLITWPLRMVPLWFPRTSTLCARLGWRPSGQFFTPSPDRMVARASGSATNSMTPGASAREEKER